MNKKKDGIQRYRLRALDSFWRDAPERASAKCNAVARTAYRSNAPVPFLPTLYYRKRL